MRQSNSFITKIFRIGITSFCFLQLLFIQLANAQITLPYSNTEWNNLGPEWTVNGSLQGTDPGNTITICDGSSTMRFGNAGDNIILRIDENPHRMVFDLAIGVRDYIGENFRVEESSNGVEYTPVADLNNDIAGLFEPGLCTAVPELPLRSTTRFIKFTFWNEATGAYFLDNLIVYPRNPNCSLVDSLSLVDFYNSTNGAAWTNTWNLNLPMATWHGVVLDGNGCVQYLFLGSNNLEGEIPDLDLANLKILDLNSNNLFGGLNNYTRMPDLEILNFNFNQLSGPIPDFFAFPNLRSLSLGQNQLDGTIPYFSNLPNLRTLYLSYNNLFGNLPDFFNMPLLEELSVGFNNLEGPIPYFTELPNLEVLYVSNNLLSQVIPEFFNCPNLKEFYCSNNNLSALLPPLGATSLLEKFHFDNNNIGGMVWDYNLPFLKEFIGFNNDLSEVLPEMQGLPALENLDLSFNQLTGPIPQFINSPNLLFIDLSDNSFVGDLPYFNNLPLLAELIVDHNELDGLIPDYSISCPSLINLDISFNNLTFEDILPSYNGNDDQTIFFEYYPQDSVFNTITYNLVEGNPFILDLLFDENEADNIYIWRKDGIIFNSITGNNNLEFAALALSDAGVYNVSVVNPAATLLTLYSYQIQLNVTENLQAGLTYSSPACDGAEITIVAQPEGQSAYSFFIDADDSGMYEAGETLLQTGSNDTLVINSLNNGDKVGVMVTLPDGTTTTHAIPVTINPLPSATPAMMEVCDDDFDGLQIFDLTDASSDVLNGQAVSDFNVLYFYNLEYANDRVNPLPDVYPTIIPGIQTVYARVENKNTACYAVAPIVLHVTALPTATLAPVDRQVCLGEDAVFTFSGPPNATVNLLINGELVPPLFTILNGMGEGSITFNNLQGTVTVEITKVSDPATDCVNDAIAYSDFVELVSGPGSGCDSACVDHIVINAPPVDMEIVQANSTVITEGIVIIPAPQSNTIKAGDYILMDAGFEVELGAALDVYIEGCDPAP